MWKDVGYKKHSVVAMLFTPTEAKSIAYSNQSNDAPNEGYRIAGEDSTQHLKHRLSRLSNQASCAGSQGEHHKDGLSVFSLRTGSWSM